MRLLYIRKYDDGPDGYLVKVGHVAAFLQGQNFMQVGIIVYEVPDWLVDDLTKDWEAGQFFKPLSKPEPATKPMATTRQ